MIVATLLNQHLHICTKILDQFIFLLRILCQDFLHCFQSRFFEHSVFRAQELLKHAVSLFCISIIIVG